MRKISYFTSKNVSYYYIYYITIILLYILCYVLYYISIYNNEKEMTIFYNTKYVVYGWAAGLQISLEIKWNISLRATPVIR